MTNTSKTNETAAFPRAGLAGSCQFALNDSGTCRKIDTRLTQGLFPGRSRVRA